MTNHPNRGRRSGSTPNPDEILQARVAAGLTQAQAGALLFTVERVWRQWESGERRMHPAFWELFQRKARE